MPRAPRDEPDGTPDDRRRARRAARRRRIMLRRAILLVAVAGLAVGIVAMAAVGGDGSATPPGAARGGAEATGRTAPVRRTPPADAPPVSIAATGDIVMGSDGYGLPSDGGASFFSDVDPLIAGDVVIGNLEGTLATGGSSKCGGSPNCFAFRTPPSYARWLRRAGFTVMNLANNHAYDYGAEGQRETVAALRRARLRDTGRPGTVAVQDVRGVRVAVLGFSTYDWSDPLLDIPAARRRVRAVAADNDVVIVTFHGGAEGADRTRVPEGSEDFLGEDRGDLRAFSHAVVDAGADLVVGHGPHVLRGMELYRGRLVAYSMGNFGGYEVFGLNATTATSAVLQARLAADGGLVSARIRPTQLVGSGTPAPGGDAVSVIRELSREDFGGRGARLAEDGTVRVPRPG